jgi:four helix bundle protein
LDISDKTLTFPSFELFKLGSQIRKASNSIPANLADGWNNRHIKMYLEGINRALGELRETLHHLNMAYRKRYLTKLQHNHYKMRYNECGRMLKGLEKSLMRYKR